MHVLTCKHTDATLASVQASRLSQTEERSIILHIKESSRPETLALLPTRPPFYTRRPLGRLVCNSETETLGEPWLQV